MDKQVSIDSSAIAGLGEDEGVHKIAADLGYQRHAVVNNSYFGFPDAGPGKWVLIDTGLSGFAGRRLMTRGRPTCRPRREALAVNRYIRRCLRNLRHAKATGGARASCSWTLTPER